MAEVDTSIYRLQPKSYFDYLQEMAGAEDAKTARERNKLALMLAQGQVQDATQARDQRNRLTQALQGLGAGATDEQRIGVLESNGEFGQADALRKSGLERQKTAAQVDKDTADAEKTRLATLHSKVDRHTQLLASIQSPQELAQWVMQGVQEGVMDQAKAQQLLSQPPRTPQEFEALKAKMQAGGLSLKDQIEQTWKAKEFGLKANNELIGPDGTVNRQLLGAKQSIAKSGASTVSVNTGQKGFDNEMKLRGDFKQEPVYKAHQEVQSAYQQIKAALGQQSPAGDLAGATKIMKLLDPGSVVRESELGMAMAASGLMDRITNYAQMTLSGQKLTPTQRKDFQSLADKLYSASTGQYNAKRKEYSDLGKGYGLDADRAIGPEASPVKVMKFDANGNLVQQ